MTSREFLDKHCSLETIREFLHHYANDHYEPRKMCITPLFGYGKINAYIFHLEGSTNKVYAIYDYHRITFFPTRDQTRKRYTWFVDGLVCGLEQICPNKYTPCKLDPEKYKFFKTEKQQDAITIITCAKYKEEEEESGNCANCGGVQEAHHKVVDNKRYCPQCKHHWSNHQVGTNGDVFCDVCDHCVYTMRQEEKEKEETV